MKRILFPLLIALTACGRETPPSEEDKMAPPPEPAITDPAPAPQSAIYRCGDASVLAEFSGDTVILTVYGETFEFHRVTSASGAKYADPDNPENIFWTRGDNATLTVAGEAYPECETRSAQAPDSGGAGGQGKPDDNAAYRAIGQEPGWILTIDDGRLSLEYDYGEKSVSVANAQKEMSNGHVEYSGAGGGQNVTVRIFEEYCADSMSGRPYPNRVEVAIGERTLQGCGGDTSALLVGGDWVVEDISGAGVIDMARTYIAFTEDGRISGSGGCNSFSGSYEIGGEGVSFGPVASTKRACPPAIMNQERKFFDVLSTVSNFQRDDDGALRLLGDNGAYILARR
ncbi:META domain-containing protein [Hyphococcus sp.]|uniref:META domain-containing protein n=1 Tax=Hyphococcus sp. TaxID=2038636 RepID=UPI003CCB76D3